MIWQGQSGRPYRALGQTSKTVLFTVKLGPFEQDGYVPVILHAGIQIDRPRVVQFSVAIVSFV